MLNMQSVLGNPTLLLWLWSRHVTPSFKSRFVFRVLCKVVVIG